MKLLSIVAIAMIFTNALFAQKTLIEGQITYHITDIQSQNEDSAPLVEMMKGSMMTVYFKDGKSLVKVEMMGSMVISDFIVFPDGSTKLYMNMMGNKIKVDIPKRSGAEETKADLIFIFNDMDKKEILGYPCENVIINSETNSAFKINAYYTKEIVANVQFIQNVDLSALKGIPLQYSIFAGDALRLEYTSQSILESLDVDPFIFNEDEYEDMSFSDFQSQMGGLFGF